MIPYETDPSLHDHEPAPVLLDDGFSPPPDDGRSFEAGAEEPAPLDSPVQRVRGS